MLNMRMCTFTLINVLSHMHKLWEGGDLRASSPLYETLYIHSFIHSFIHGVFVECILLDFTPTTVFSFFSGNMHLV